MDTTAVRLALFERFAALGRLPSRAEVAQAAGIAEAEVVDAYRGLAAERVIVLAPGTDDPWMVNPFSATPTPFRAEAGGRAFWANCIWDALGVVAMLGGTGAVRTPCPDCGEAIDIDVEDGRPAGAPGLLVHFAVPAARWWENIAFT
jgi:DNA-binding transcriptional MocR family regulator